MSARSSLRLSLVSISARQLFVLAEMLTSEGVRLSVLKC
jgi:hypothetical protein